MTGVTGRLRQAVRDSAVSLIVSSRQKSTIISALHSTLVWLATASRSSAIYRWLTKEPEPDVIVIDLRETFTVGPVITILDHSLNRAESVLATLAPYWHDSRVGAAVTWTARQLHHAADTRVGRTLKALLEPPEPPDEKPD